MPTKAELLKIKRAIPLLNQSSNGKSPKMNLIQKYSRFFICVSPDRRGFHRVEHINKLATT